MSKAQHFVTGWRVRKGQQSTPDAATQWSVQVESRMGAVAWGLWPSPRFPSPLISRVEDWRAGLGRSLGYWDRSRARPAVGGGFPFLLFRLQDGFTVPPWLTFPEAPL